MVGLVICVWTVRCACAPYYPDKTIDSGTGAIIVNSSFRVKPLLPKITALCGSANRAVARFEAKEDTSFFGKNLSRVLVWAWFYVVVALCGTLFLLVAIPAVVVLNTVVCVSGLALSPVLALGAAVGEYLLTVLVFDWNATTSTFLHALEYYLWCVSCVSLCFL